MIFNNVTFDSIDHKQLIYSILTKIEAVNIYVNNMEITAIEAEMSNVHIDKSKFSNSKSS